VDGGHDRNPELVDDERDLFNRPLIQATINTKWKN